MTFNLELLHDLFLFTLAKKASLSLIGPNRVLVIRRGLYNDHYSKIIENFFDLLDVLASMEAYFFLFVLPKV